MQNYIKYKKKCVMTKESKAFELANTTDSQIIAH